MQVTLYFAEEDTYLIKLVDQVARRERKSRSAVVLSIIEEYFERNKRVGEILIDMGYLAHRELERVLKLQKNGSETGLLGELLIKKRIVDPEAVGRALAVQNRLRGNLNARATA